MKGEQVTVVRRKRVGKDIGNNPVYETSRETVNDVLVMPPTMADAGGERPDGITVDVSLAFPREYDGDSLRGCSVEVRGHIYKVVGDPQRLDGGVTPTRWNMVVQLFRSDG